MTKFEDMYSQQLNHPEKLEYGDLSFKTEDLNNSIQSLEQRTDPEIKTGLRQGLTLTLYLL